MKINWERSGRYRLNGVWLNPGLNDLSDDDLRKLEKPVGGKNLFAYFASIGAITAEQSALPVFVSQPPDGISAEVVEAIKAAETPEAPVTPTVRWDAPKKRGRPRKWR